MVKLIILLHYIYLVLEKIREFFKIIVERIKKNFFFYHYYFTSRRINYSSLSPICIYQKIYCSEHLTALLYTNL